jgi:8-amino-7-oxononanoate synthase
MREKGFFIPAVRFPTVSRGKARLRLTLTASHTPEEIDGFFKVLNQIMPNTVSANKPTPQEIK